MQRFVIALAVAAAALSTAGFASQKPSPLTTPAPAHGTGLPTGQCFRSHDIRNHTIADPQTLLLNVNGRDIYRVTMSGSCLAGAISSDPIVTQEPPGSSTICKPLDLDLSIARGGIPSRCLVDSIVKLTPQEVAALPKKIRP